MLAWASFLKGEECFSLVKIQASERQAKEPPRSARENRTSTQQHQAQLPNSDERQKPSDYPTTTTTTTHNASSPQTTQQRRPNSDDYDNPQLQKPSDTTLPSTNLVEEVVSRSAAGQGVGSKAT
mmetsp:Transcript_17617/g.42472  ORF Transcript_17617/g.42472 Transcript_17617/m.42472 type:complete len:124 (+) Transcript_17617:1080-1451(+)